MKTTVRVEATAGPRERVAEALRREPLSRTALHRLSLRASSAGWGDALTLVRHPVGRRLADQLYRALGSIGANVAEGYSRSSRVDRARFLEYALGSARESREWYLRAIPILGCDRVLSRVAILNQVIAILASMLRRAHSEGRSGKRIAMSG